MIDACRDWIEAALAYSGGTHTFEDVAEGIASGRMQLWPAPDGCIVTEIVAYPRKKVCNGFLAGGDMARLLDMIPAIEAWAAAQGCASTELTGRRGWVRVFAPMGYQEAATTLRKEIT
ncbi:MAG: hypothetical protein ACK4NW_01995 [Roseinatronobacter sp.]